MVDINQNNINSQIQFVRDFLSASADASYSAESNYRKLYEKIVIRGIEVAESETPAIPDSYFSRNVYFVPSEEEREHLLKFYSEWKAYAEIHQELVEEYEYIVKHKKKLDRSELHLTLLKNKLWELAIKIIFYPTVFLAAIIIIKNSI